MHGLSPIHCFICLCLQREVETESLALQASVAVSLSTAQQQLTQGLEQADAKLEGALAKMDADSHAMQEVGGGMQVHMKCKRGGGRACACMGRQLPGSHIGGKGIGASLTKSTSDV